MPIRSSLSRDEFIAWPYVDTLYDYIPFLQRKIAFLPEEKRGTEIAIVGAGAAGMVAAFELLKIGVFPVIYEATGRIGGRLYSKNFTDNGEPATAFAELGAMRIPVSSKVFYHYADMFALDSTSQFPDPGVSDTLLYFQNKPLLWKAFKPLPTEFCTVQENWMYFITPLVAKIHTAWMKGDLGLVSKIWQMYIERYKDKSFYQVLRDESAVWTHEDLDRFGALGIGTGGFAPIYHIGFMEILRIIVNQWEKNQKLIREGVSKLTESFYSFKLDTPDGRKSLEDLKCVHLNTPILAIECGQTNKPSLSFLNTLTGEKASKEYEAIIVATSTRAMQTIGLTLPSNTAQDILSDDVKRALRKLHMINSSKLFIRTKTKFWLNDGSGIPMNIQTDELPKGIYLLDYPQTDNGVVCISYTWGDDSVKLIALDPEERFRIFTQSIRKMCPRLARHLIPLNNEIICIDWEAEPYYYGAFKLQLPGQDQDVWRVYYQFQSVLDRESDRGVYLAGDGVSWSGGWVEGALHTGINAACAVAKRLGATLPADSPLQQNPGRYNYY